MNDGTIRFLSILLFVFGLAVLVLAISYPVYRDWMFDNIPRSWTLSDFKAGVIISSAIVLIITLFYCIWPLRHRQPDWPSPTDWRVVVAIIGVFFAVFIASFTFFYPQYIHDRTWVAASYSSMTQQEIELQTIGQVMKVDGIIGFHYRALFLKFFQGLFFPLALILPTLFWMARNYIQQGTRGIRLPLIMAILMFISYFSFGLWLYG